MAGTIRCGTGRPLAHGIPSATVTSDPSLLTAEAITKSYEGVRALKGVSFDLQAGEVPARSSLMREC